MPTLTRRLLLGLAPLAFGALVGTAVVAAGLERSAQQLRARESLQADTLFLAKLASDPSQHGCLQSAVPLLMGARPQLAYARVDGPDGRALVSAGDEKAVGIRGDRTFLLKGSPVRVRVVYRDQIAEMSLAIRVAVWLAASGLFTVTVFIALGALLRREVVRPLEALRRWAAEGGTRPDVRSAEVERLAAALEGWVGRPPA